MKPVFNFEEPGIGIEDIQANASTILKEIEGNKEKNTFTGLELFNSEIDEIPKLVDPIISTAAVFALVGASDTGKSALLRQLALSIVQNEPFIGFRVLPKFGKVLMVVTEDEAQAVSFLLKKQAKTSKNLQNITFHFDTEDIPTYITAHLETQQCDLIIIDAWADVFGQNLNDSALIRQALNKYRTIANTYQCAIGFLHHTGKRTENLVPSKNNILSGQGFEAKMRLVIELRNDLEIPNIKHFCIVKGNYLGRDFKQSSFVLDFNEQDFTFTNTEDRVNFEDLANSEKPGDKPERKKIVKAHEIPKETHLEVISKKIDPDEKLKSAQLDTRLEQAYAIWGVELGSKLLQQYRNHLIQELRLISKFGKDKSPNAYYRLTTAPLTDTPEKEGSS